MIRLSCLQALAPKMICGSRRCFHAVDADWVPGLSHVTTSFAAYYDRMMRR